MKKTSITKRLAGALLSLVMVLGRVPGTVRTAEAATVTSGTCGDDLTWTLDDAGTLTISGTGAMENYGWGDAPWHSNRESVRNVCIKSGVTSIGDGAFQDCTSLTSITIPNSVTSIGDGAFAWNDNLTSVSIPNTVTSIGFGAFFRCDNLASITIPESVLEIKDEAFAECNNLTSIVIPDGVTKIGAAAFASCGSLTEIEVSAENPAYISVDGVLFNKDMTELIQCPCRKEGKYTIPNGVITVGWCAFADCTLLAGVTIPSSVEAIRGGAFDNCTGLTSVYITDIGKWCKITYELIGYGIPGSNPLQYGAHLYLNGELITKMTIPDSVTSIEPYAFLRYDTLETIVFTGDAPNINYYAFCNVTATVYYPANNPTWTESVRQNYGGTLTWEAYTAPEFQQVSATLGADVGLNFYTDEEAASVVFTWNGGESVAQVSGTAAESGFRYTCPLTAKEIDAQVTAEVKDAQGNTLDTVTYSVAEYLAQLTVANGYDQETENMAQATLAYGMAAKAHFAGGAAVAPAAVEVSEIATYYDPDNMVTAAAEVSYYGRSLLLKDLTILRLYFAAESAPVVRVDGTAATVKPYSEAGYYTVDIPVMARALRDSFAVTVDGTDIAFSVGVNDYIAKAVQDNAADSSLAGLCRALYWYGAAAQAMPEA